MLLTPRYGPTPVISLDGDPAAVAEPLIRQRRRSVEVLRDLTEDEWSHPSRCDGWSVQDVANHLATTNAFWEGSIRLGIAGTPSEMMMAFDPVASPARMVSESTHSIDEVLDVLAISVESLATCLGDLAPADWTATAESPPGHVSISAVAHHALWDSWVHERDVLLPLGKSPDERPDEVVACLRYVAGFSPALALNGGATRSGEFDVSVTEPDAGFHVAIGSDVVVSEGTRGSGFELAGQAVDLLEALSFRGPLTQRIPDDLKWAFSGLSTVFDL